MTHQQIREQIKYGNSDSQNSQLLCFLLGYWKENETLWQALERGMESLSLPVYDISEMFKGTDNPIAVGDWKDEVENG